MATTYYKSLVCLNIEAEDATYVAEFHVEMEKGSAWEYDPMCDAHMTVTRRTGRVKVEFKPDLFTMAFPEDAGRPMTYEMPVEKARELYSIVRDGAKFWFALDMASVRSK